ncbi:hypothetical protein ACHAW5_007172 [Stephanodiscus triporus]|uniref:Peptidase M43 pregnancy-associated plasma-A domain-containing protein n=1 Tax=Stephanodiscus triporus TaxID=2934178 RepID=A0ABD3P0D9_9STRA
MSVNPTTNINGGLSDDPRDESFQKGRRCHTEKQTPEERDKKNGYFKAWKKKKKAKAKKGDFGYQLEERRLFGGCFDCVDWSETVITVPVYFHVVHDGDTGKQYTYEVDSSFIERSITALNYGFQGLPNTEFIPYPSRSYSRYNVTEADSKIRFCLAGTTTTDNAAWYNAGPYSEEVSAMKQALKVGGSETMNVYAHQPGGGILGYAWHPQNDEFLHDGVVILNDVMPGGPLGTLSQGNTLTHEVGHWLDLVHTHDNGCSGEGDYMIPAGNEATPSFGCEVAKDDCPGGGPNPIHNFMSYSNVRMEYPIT